MKGLLSLWSSLDLRRRAIVVGATVGMFLAVLGLARLAAQPDMALLYAGLEDSAAGEVVAALDRRGALYEVRGNAIFVAAAQRDILRMELATEGLPATTGAGYELLDGLSGFGTTAQMFDAAYWRAKEGELARTILAMPQVRAARVHIAEAPESPFRTPIAPTASVTLTTGSGGLDASRASAVRHLVAAAVPGMLPENVSVIDTLTGLIPPEGGDGPAAGGAQGRAAEIRANVERLLAARVGPGRAVVEVAVELVTERERLTERSFDPQGRVAISSETEQKSGSSQQGPDSVSVASNLPEGDAAAGSAERSQTTESRERTNYEVSETQREVERLPGAIRRLSVAVLVDGEPVAAEDGTVTVQPRPEAELAVLRDLVASAVGFDEARGDVLTVRSLPFRPQGAEGTLAEPGWWRAATPLDATAIAQAAIVAAVLLGLGLFVLRPILASGRRPPELAPPAAALALPPAAAAAPAGGVLEGIIDDGDEPAHLAVVGRDRIAAAEEPPPDPVARLRRLIEARQTEAVEILRGWMDAGEEAG